VSDLIKLEPFSKVDVDDPFFNTLKADYPGFEEWYARKAASGARAYTFRGESGQVEGFLYLKLEDEAVDDVVPPLAAARRIKIGTFKIEGHGTKLGERFLKKVFDQAIARDQDRIYVTVFPKHAGLTRLFDRYGFVKVAEKPSATGDVELVLERDMRSYSGGIETDYPFIHSAEHRKYLLAIYPKFHTQLLPDSILNSETFDVVQDLSHTNSIHKVYICFMDVDVLKPGDILVIYRTSDDQGPAEYRSVATSIGVVEEVRRASEFASCADFIAYCEPYSVFPSNDLRTYYAKGARTRVIKFTYNAALSKRLIRKSLIDHVGLDRNRRWGFFELTDDQFSAIIDLGGVRANLIVD
jgi:hypothetical protein